jgi:cysteine desulfurase
VDATYLPVTQEGSIDPDTLLKSITARTKLISIMAANNITGALQPIRQLGRIAKERGILFHTDAVQAAGKIPLDMEDDCIDLLSISSHKIHGPKGVGALVIRDGIKIDPLIHGGGQENGRRSSTENVAGIAGFAKAAQISLAEMNEEAARLVNLRERIIEGVTRLVPGSYLIGQRYRRLPGHACFGFNGLEGETIKMLLGLDDAGFAVSTGSACSSHKASEPSYVLTAMGLDPFRARGSLRISLGRFNTDDEVQRFLDVFPGIVSCLNPIFTRA